MTVYEPDLEDLISHSVHQERPPFADPGDVARLVGEADVIVISMSKS